MRNKSIITSCIFLFSICIFLFSYNKLSAQENGIFELNENNTFSKVTSKNTKANDRADFYDLTYKLQPTFYVNNRTIKENNNYSNKVTKLTFNDLKSFDVLYRNNSAFNDIELITITLKKVEDLNNKLDLTNIQGFGNLKFIYIKCYFKCSEQQIKDFIKSNSNVRVFYKNEIPS
ncbi:hypothetical protein ACFSKN_01630 [Mariniflexile gromovii]|uniref:Uncharacterized protein n=1 Tax=Mariniflexile gromovii TaxID=362523 RepID=A0ABS4BP56_9FLAO|nr:hypothetical protein [Mariniflexile gromovii]MBP0902302.1 hypothetical protein [Mariniflexile gromovii]